MLSVCTDGGRFFFFSFFPLSIFNLFIYLFLGRGGEGARRRRQRGGNEGKEGEPWRGCRRRRRATVTRAAVIGLHIEGFCGAAGWANSQLDLSDGIQSSSLPSLLSSFLLSFTGMSASFFFSSPTSPHHSPHLFLRCSQTSILTPSPINSFYFRNPLRAYIVSFSLSSTLPLSLPPPFIFFIFKFFFSHR